MVLAVVPFTTFLPLKAGGTVAPSAKKYNVLLRALVSVAEVGDAMAKLAVASEALAVNVLLV